MQVTLYAPVEAKRYQPKGYFKSVTVFFHYYFCLFLGVHLESSSVNHPELCEKQATQPMVYVVSFDNSEYSFYLCVLFSFIPCLQPIYLKKSGT